MNLPKKVDIMEVCPRDGWQNHKVMIPVETKIKYIKKMIDYGAKRMDVASFVNPKYVPQMAGATDVVKGVLDYAEEKGCMLSGLTLNKRGVDDAAAAGLTNVQFVLSVSEEHNIRNSRRTIAESRQMFRDLVPTAKGLNIMLALPCVFGSPFGDEIDMGLVKDIIEEAFELGISEIGLADTAGVSTPEHTSKVLSQIRDYCPAEKTSVHLHDTRGMGMANAYVALTEGYTRLDSALGAMGGCNFVPGAKGNIATEDLVNMCEQMGIETGYDLKAVCETAHEMGQEIKADIVSSLTDVY
jgi:hydroxymethylglutaryl-CoA lyase